MGGAYRFEYGLAGGTLDNATDWEPVPPGLFSEIWESTVASFRNWLVYGAGHQVSEAPPAISAEWPFGIDRNHLDGIGHLTLLYGWRPGVLPDIDLCRSARHRGGVDLRGGTVAFQVRHRGMSGAGGLYVLGANSYLDGNTAGPASQWMMTGQYLRPSDIPDGRWADIAFEIDPDPDAWTFAAGNRTEQAASYRYVYSPLRDIVGHHNSHLTMTEVFAAEAEVCEGALDLRGGRLRCRDWSMLRDGYGAVLVESPGRRDTSSNLVNGMYRKADDGWHGTPGATFVWRLPDGARPETLALVQHPAAPAKRVAVRLRSEHAILWEVSVDLPAPAPTHPNRVFVDFPPDLRVGHLEIRVMSGHSDAVAGLLGVEAFGAFRPAIVERAPFMVSADIGPFASNSSLDYRLVYRDDACLIAGETMTYTAPPCRKPLLFSLYALDDARSHWIVRANAMGLPTILHIAIDGGEVATLSLGESESRRHAAFRLPVGRSRRGGALSVMARNAAGDSAVHSATLA